MQTLTLKLINPLESALGYTPYVVPGTRIEFRFDEPLSHFQHFDLGTGHVVVVCFGIIDADKLMGHQPSDSEVWGSNSKWIAVQRDDGGLDDADGKEVDEGDLFPHPQPGK